MSTPTPSAKRILVIRHGAFGDMIMAMGAFHAIRAFHAGAHITLLTTAPFVGLVEGSAYFDRIVVDDRPKLWRLGRWWRLARSLRNPRFDRVYDLQRSQRTDLLYRVITAGRQTEWSGVTPGCSHFVHDDRQDGRHILDKLAEQLHTAGLPKLPPSDITWMTGDVDRFHLPRPYGLIIAGCTPRRPEKRAPAKFFADFAEWLLSQGITPVLLGTTKEKEQIDAVQAACPRVINLCDRTGFGDIAALARGAVGALGNDTGAMHLIAATGCPTLVLFSGASDPKIVAPRGACVRILQREPLSALPMEDAIRTWERMLSDPKRT
ncbi:MAG TPA: glycosyltransferase family 9 protein [Telmatospirillum sp.]|nr:glycosyltransferase family 9 protein [Telmatospirillum sp.]